MSREGNQDTLNIVCLLKPIDAHSMASLMLKRKLEIVRRVLRNLKTGQHENKRNISEGVMTSTEKIIHERTGHATYDPRCETCLKVRGTGTHPRTAVAEASYVDCATVKNCHQGAEIKILVGAGPRGEGVCEGSASQWSKIRRSRAVPEGAASATRKTFQCTAIKRSACSQHSRETGTAYMSDRR